MKLKSLPVSVDHRKCCGSFRDLRDNPPFCEICTERMKEKNQCDGCRRGLPLKDGIHKNSDSIYDIIGCTAEFYEND